MTQEPNSKKEIIDYDGRWKTIIEQLFDDFMAFFMPELFEEIDFSKGVVFLDKELQKIMPQKERKGKRISDCLAKVFLKNGKEKWILVHIEVQSSDKPNFSARMFKYFYRIFDKYERDVAAIAVFTHEKHSKNDGIYHKNFFGTRITYEYNTYKISEQSVESLKQQTNPFALAVLANKYVLASKNKDKQRLQFKIQLLQLLRERNFSRKRIFAILTFIQYLMLLPNELELEFENIISGKHQNHTNMREVILEPKIIDLINHCIIEAHGDTLENLLEKEREKEREKARQEREKTVMKLHHNLGLEVKRIANILSLEESIVLAIINKNKP